MPIPPSRPFHRIIAVPPGAGAMVLLAPECGPWGRVARGTTMRSLINPLGNDGYAFVADANLHTSRHLCSFWLEST